MAVATVRVEAPRKQSDGQLLLLPWPDRQCRIPTCPIASRFCGAAHDPSGRAHWTCPLTEFESRSARLKNSAQKILICGKGIVRYILLFLVIMTTSVQASEVCSIVNGAKLIAQDSQHTYLGEITNSYASNSIFNEYGRYGNEYSSISIWNKYGTFGSEYSSYSPFNKYSSMPPMMIKKGKVIGYLTANKYIEASISPNLLKALCKDSLY